MGKISIELGDVDARVLSDDEIDLIHSSLTLAMTWGVLSRPEAASAAAVCGLIMAKDIKRGDKVILKHHVGAVATAIYEREGNEVSNEDDPQCPRDILMSPEQREVLVSLRQLLPSEADTLNGEYYDGLMDVWASEAGSANA